MVRRIKLYILFFVTFVLAAMSVVNAAFVSFDYRQSDVSYGFINGIHQVGYEFQVPEGESEYRFFVQSPRKNSTLNIRTTYPLDDAYTFYINDEEVPSKGGSIKLPVSKEYYVVRLTINAPHPFTIYGAYIEADKPIYYDGIYLALFVSLLVFAAEIFIVCSKKSFFKTRLKLSGCKAKSAAICLLIGFTASIVAFNPYIFYGDDVVFSLLRIEGLYQSLLNGRPFEPLNQFYLFNSGFADSIMYPRLMLFVPALFRLAGISPAGTYNLFTITINILTSFSAYYSIKKMVKSYKGACVGAALYVLAPFRIALVYVGCALGSIIAMIFIPLFFYGLYSVLYEDKKRWEILTAACFGVVCSHLVSAVLCALVGIVFIIYSLERLRDANTVKSIILSGGFLVLMSIGVVVPIICFGKENLNWSRLGMLMPSKNLVYFADVLKGFLNIDSESAFVFLIFRHVVLGVPLTISGILALYYFMGDEKAKREKLIGFVLAASVVMTIACTVVFPWKIIEILPVLNKISCIQFAWRWFYFIIFFLAIAGAYVIAHLSNNGRKNVFAAALILCFVLGVYDQSSIMANGEYFVSKADAVPVGNLIQDDIIVFSEYFYEGMDFEQLINDAGKYSVSDRSVKVENYKQTMEKITFDVKAPSGGSVDLPKTAYPLYSAVMNGEKLELDKNENSCLRVILPKGEGTVSVETKVPLLWKVLYTISALAAVCFVYTVFKTRKRIEGL